MIDRECGARRQQRLAALVAPAPPTWTAITVNGQQNASKLIFDQRPLLLDDKHLLRAGAGVANELWIERPGHADAAPADTEATHPFLAQPKQTERLHDIRLRLSDRHDHQTLPAGAGIDANAIETVGP